MSSLRVELETRNKIKLLKKEFKLKNVDAVFEHVLLKNLDVNKIIDLNKDTTLVDSRDDISLLWANRRVNCRLKILAIECESASAKKCHISRVVKLLLKLHEASRQELTTTGS